MSLPERLAGTRFFVTGATGFLGTALVERLLRTIPDSAVVVMIRATRRATPAQRAMREIVKNDCFDRLRAELGDAFDEEMSRRIIAVSGDVTSEALGLDADGLAELARCQVVIHSAAAVSFDSPLDQAVEINLLGPVRVGDAVVAARAFAEAAGIGPGPAHLIAVSTAYVASTHQGEAKEQLLDANRFSVEVDWRREVEASRRLRADFEAESRRAEELQGFAAAARAELGAAGDHVVAERAERLREDWVKRQLVDAGTSRALSLGWPDAYPYTKALGERALVESHATGPDAVPISIVRPSIIESSLAEPVPGWIRGFRMAEPIIISYAKGLLKEFPGVPEGVVDVIPVDLVVATIIAVADHGPTPGEARVYQSASGVRNPLVYGELVDLVQRYFTERPLYDDQGQPIAVPAWSFPGRGRVQRQLRRATTTIDQVEKVLGSLPLRGRRAAFTASLDDRNAQAKRALAYVELYGAYSETSARYRIDHTLSLRAALDEADRTAFEVDPLAVDWPTYVSTIHLPSVVGHARVRTTPGRTKVESRSTRGRKAVLEPARQLAVFDLENTLIASNVVDTYAWLASRHLPPGKRLRFVAQLVAEAPSLLALDRRDRGDFLQSFYRRYEGAPLAELQRDAWELFHRQFLPKAFPAGFARVREHRALGHRTLLITGALDFVVAPIAPLFDDVVAARMGVRDGKLTGRMEYLPPIGEARAIVLEDYAERHEIDLRESVAYADSASDLALLEAVGYPVAVNPEARLTLIARRRGWHVEDWPKASGGAARPLPLGPFDRRRPGTVAPGGAQVVLPRGGVQ